MAQPGSARVPGQGAYRPILRARRGELAALHHLHPTAVVAPILEPVVLDRLGDLLRLVRDLPPATATIGVDVGGFADPDDRLRSPTLDLADDLPGYVPVVRTYDSDRRLAEHGLAARMAGGVAVFRVRPFADVLNPAAALGACERVWRGTGLGPEELDLVVDLAEVGCTVRADRFIERGQRILRWAQQRDWRSVTLAAGAMPANLDDLPTDEPVAVERYDADYWWRVADPGIGYGDYGVTSPTRRHGVHHRQLPTLRYATAGAWWIHRWSRRGGRGDDRCYDLCRTLVGSQHWPVAGARCCWGDAQIARRARLAPGAGSPSGWMAWSTSHHLAQVLSELAGRVPAAADRPPRRR